MITDWRPGNRHHARSSIAEELTTPLCDRIDSATGGIAKNTGSGLAIQRSTVRT
ncbi:hypothetical protein LZ318_28820 [Saccharopolyspora indica]|uniref:hypothetical protein n=1 Tax=Saccharopolyspora indica TaxID=1229659 RepID=UPI0022EA52C1|nr:hypothetical protein [Saccharopolyspora indica]MDA3646312.1 hypothetical protein [Saccharopolyspora indica]